MNNIFEDLYSLKEAADIWHLEESTIRKAIASNRFVEGKDVKKFGKQWVVSKNAMEREYGILVKKDEIEEPNEKKAEDIYYFVFELVNAYSAKYKEKTKQVNSTFKKNNIYEYIYECFDYLHLLSINENVKDIRSRIRRGIKYGSIARK